MQRDNLFFAFELSWFNSIAKWLDVQINTSSKSFRPGTVQNLYEVKVFFAKRMVEILIARVDWFRNHPKKYFFGLNSPTVIWDTLFEDHSPACFIPLKLVYSRAVAVSKMIKFSRFEADKVNIIIPLPSKSL